MNFLYLKMLASRRGKAYHCPLGYEGYVEESLARQFIKDGAAREIKAPPDAPPLSEAELAKPKNR